MAVVSVVEQVHIYDYGLDSDNPMTGVPGTNGLAAAQFTTDINIWVCLMSDGSTYIAPNGGTVYRNKNDLTHISTWDGWDLSLYGNDKWFSCNATTAGPSLSTDAPRFYYGYRVLKFDPVAGNKGKNASCTLPLTSKPTVGSSTLPENFVKVKNISEWEMDGDKTTYYYYILGYVNDGGTYTSDDITMYSAKIQITQEDAPGLFEYYPWERRISNVWYSLNRDGSQSTAAGLFRRLSGSWSPCTNRPAGEPNHGFRYNGGWQKSPKSGQGA